MIRGCAAHAARDGLAKAEELTRGKKSDLEKLQAIYDYVAKNFRYVSLSFGLGRYQPHSASEVLANQYGDCKDKHTLLAALADAVRHAECLKPVTTEARDLFKLPLTPLELKAYDAVLLDPPRAGAAGRRGEEAEVHVRGLKGLRRGAAGDVPEQRAEGGRRRRRREVLAPALGGGVGGKALELAREVGAGGGKTVFSFRLQTSVDRAA